MKKSMRVIKHFALLATPALLFAAPLLAQDAAAPIRRSSPTPEETAAPAPSATPTPTPTPTPTVEKPAPTPAETPVASEAPKATPEQREETASTPSRKTFNEPPVRPIEKRPAGAPRPPVNERSETPPALPPASKPTFDLSDSGGGYIGATIRSLENRWQKSIVSHDTAVVDELVADDFVGTSSTGRLGSKSTLLTEARRDKNTYTSANARSIMVRSFGPHVAVATGVTRESGTTPDGQRFNNSRRFTDTWMERNGRWQCIASHATELPKD